MPRNISFALTTAQFRARTKTVTRRMGWEFLKTGDVLCGVEKCQGLKAGEKVVKLGLIQVADARREPLRRMTDDIDYGFAETVREGFPVGTALYWPSAFVPFFCGSHKGCTPDTIITRIEFVYLP